MKNILPINLSVFIINGCNNTDTNSETPAREVKQYTIEPILNKYLKEEKKAEKLH